MSTNETDRMPPANDAAGMKRWHDARGLPWGPVFNGPEPVLIRRMARKVMGNITVHLTNEHRIQPDRAQEQHHIQHMLAHMYGQFLAGQEHYHEEPPA